jgi:serine/threonine-protein kinase RsbW
MKFSLDLPRETLSIPVIRRVLGDTLRGLGVSEGCIADLLVAASEACTNVVQHVDSATHYEVIASIAGDHCVLKVADTGHGFESDAQKGAGPDSESGRGIKIMRALVDDVIFDSRPDTGTAVYLQKRLSWQEESPMRLLEPELLETAG